MQENAVEEAIKETVKEGKGLDKVLTGSFKVWHLVLIIVAILIALVIIGIFLKKYLDDKKKDENPALYTNNIDSIQDTKTHVIYKANPDIQRGEKSFAEFEQQYDPENEYDITFKNAYYKKVPSDLNSIPAKQFVGRIEQTTIGKDNQVNYVPAGGRFIYNDGSDAIQIDDIDKRQQAEFADKIDSIEVFEKDDNGDFNEIKIKVSRDEPQFDEVIKQLQAGEFSNNQVNIVFVNKVVDENNKNAYVQNFRGFVNKSGFPAFGDIFYTDGTKSFFAIKSILNTFTQTNLNELRQANAVIKTAVDNEELIYTDNEDEQYKNKDGTLEDCINLHAMNVVEISTTNKRGVTKKEFKRLLNTGQTTEINYFTDTNAVSSFKIRTATKHEISCVEKRNRLRMTQDNCKMIDDSNVLLFKEPKEIDGKKIIAYNGFVTSSGYPYSGNFDISPNEPIFTCIRGEIKPCINNKQPNNGLSSSKVNAI